ncbi:MMPL family protein [Planctomyces sp. SH-PL14]|nr:MMPL family protein [Planctomyces sp. SH-PL14]
MSICAARNGGDSLTTGDPSHSRIDRLTEFLIRNRGGLFLAAVVLSLLCIWPASKLELDESIESFFAPDDPLLQAYVDSKASFGADEFVLVAYPTDPPLIEKPSGKEGKTRIALNEEVLDESRDFARELNQVPGVRPESTQSLHRTLRPFDDALSPINLPPIARRALVFPAKLQRLVEMSRKVLLSEDSKTAAIILRLLPESPDISRAEVFRQLRVLAAKHNPPAMVAGEPVQVNDMFRYVEQDGLILGVATSALLIVIILAMFRNLRWVVIPLLIVHINLVWTKAFLVLTGMKLSMVSSMLTSLTTIIGISTVMHITVIYRERRAHLDSMEALKQTFRELLIPVFWTIVTTAIGFLSVMTSGIVPVRSFGVMMTVGTMLVIPACLMIIPGGILLGKFSTDPRHAPGEERLVSGLRRLSDWVGAHPKSLSVATILVSIVGIWGCFRLTVETDFSRNFRAGSPIVQALEFFESRLGGVGNWEVNFPAPTAKEPITEEFLQKVRDLSTDLQTLKTPQGIGLTKVVPITEGLDFVPPVAASTIEEKLDVMRMMQPEYIPSLYNSDKGRMRIVLRAFERQPAEVKLELIRRVEETAKKYFPDAHATGLYVLLANLISSLMADQISSGLVSVAGMTLSVWLAFRSLGFGVVSLAPNILPILCVIGGMGWMNIPINIGTAMIASVAIGFTIDSSVHYFAGYVAERKKGLSRDDAIRETSSHVGRALVLTNVALVIGFSVLALSNFIPLVYFGVLVSLAMLGGLVGNLIMLPVMLRWLPDSAGLHNVPQPVSEPVAAAASAPA